MSSGIGISFVGLLLVGTIVAAIGLGLLSLVAKLIGSLVNRRGSQPPVKRDGWSGVGMALIITGLGLAVLMAVGLIWVVRTGPTTTNVRLVQSHGEIIASGRNGTALEIRDSPSDRRIPIDVDEDTVPEKTPEKTPILTPEIEKADQESVTDSGPLTSSTADPSDAEKEAFIEARKVQLEDLAGRIGQLVRAHLESASENGNASPLGQAAKSDNGDIVVYQPSEDMVKQLLGSTGQEFLKSFNSELPGRIRQTYALIPLTPPVGTTVPVEPLLAASGLQSIANSIVSFAERAKNAPQAEMEGNETTSSPAEADGSLTVAPLIRPKPEWMSKTDGRRVRAETEAIFPGEDPVPPLTAAINDALEQHISSVTATMDKALHEQVKFVRMELSPEAAKKFVVDEYELQETMSSEKAGQRPFLKKFALLEFPESVDQIAVGKIRQSVQQDRVAGLGFVVGLAWLSICSAGFGIRQWRNGRKLRRMISAAVFAIIAVPALLCAVAMVISLSRGNVPHVPWNVPSVTIDLQEV